MMKILWDVHKLHCTQLSDNVWKLRTQQQESTSGETHETLKTKKFLFGFTANPNPRPVTTVGYHPTEYNTDLVNIGDWTTAAYI